MTQYRPSYTVGIVLAITLALSPDILGQADTTVTLKPADTSEVVEKTKYHALYAAAGFGSNMIYLGATISQDQPFGYASLTYGYRNKLYLSLSAVTISNLDPFVAFYSASGSFNHEFNSWFDISVSTSGYKVATELTDTLFSSFVYGEVNLGVDLRLIYTRLSAGGLVAEDNHAYFQIKNSRYFQTPEFGKKKVNFSFDPYVNLLFGSVTQSETIDGNIVTYRTPLRKGRQDNPVVTTTTKTTTFFGLLELDFGIPVSFNTKRLTLEAEPSYVLPIYNDPSYPSTKGFVLLLSAYFKIF